MTNYNKPDKRILLVLVLLATLLLLSSCASIPWASRGGPVFPSHPEQIALLVPLHGTYGSAGRAVRDGFMAAYYHAENDNTRNTSVHIYDTSKNHNIRTLYREAVSNGASLVVGPLQKGNVQQIAGSDPSVPILALNYLPNNKRAPGNMFEFGLSPQNEAILDADRAWRDNHQSMIIIYPDSNWGKGIAQSFATQWHQLGGYIVASLAYQPDRNHRKAIRNLFKINQSEARAGKLKLIIGEKMTYVPQRRKDVDAIFLVATPQTAREIVPLLRFYYAGNLPVYAISAIYGGIADPNYYRDMNGVYFPDMPWLFTKNQATQQLQYTLAKNWPTTYRSHIRLYALGMDAYRLTTEMNLLVANAGKGIAGATGTLHLQQQRIFRQLVWAQFKNGKAVEIE